MKFTIATIAALFVVTADAKPRWRKPYIGKCRAAKTDDVDAIKGHMFFLQRKNKTDDPEKALYGSGRWNANLPASADYTVAAYGASADCSEAGTDVGSFSKDGDDTTKDRWAKTELTGYSLKADTDVTDIADTYFGLYDSADATKANLFCCQVKTWRKPTDGARRLDGHMSDEEAKWMEDEKAKWMEEQAMQNGIGEAMEEQDWMKDDMHADHDDHDMHRDRDEHDMHRDRDEHDMHRDHDKESSWMDDMWNSDSATTMAVSGAAMTLAAALAF